MEDLVINEVFHEGVEAACLMANLLEVVECWQDNLMTTFD